MHKIRIAIAILTVTALVAGYAIRASAPAPDERPMLAELAPGVSFSDKSGQPPVYVSSDGTVAFNSHDIVPDIRGYAGPIKSMVALSPDGTILGVRIIEHKETENFVHQMVSPAYLDSFKGKSVHERFIVGKNVDAISRATVSVEALASSIKESSRLVALARWGIQTQDKTLKQNPISLQAWGFAVVFIMTLGLYTWSQRQKHLLRFRDAALLLCVLVLGLWLSSPYSILMPLNALMLRAPGSLPGMLVLVAVTLSFVMHGRFYCGWLCPFGALTELTDKVPTRKWALSEQLDMRLRWIKYILLALTIAVVLVSGLTSLGNFETYVTLFSWHGNALTWGLVAVSLISALWLRRMWCRFLCPVGALGALLSPASPQYPSAPSCPMSNPCPCPQGECIRCNRCLVVK